MSLEGTSPLDRPGATSTLLAPPTILEPSTDNNDKRTSQLVYNSGFINRFSEFSPAALNTRTSHAYMGSSGSTLSKGWKPFKLVMKGSKLYFYKPPGDRSTAVKDLFPTELVAVLEEEGVTEESDVRGKDEGGESGSGRGKEKEEGRRKRAFWGSTTHPGLISRNGIVERGTFEALIHESVFSTTFAQHAEPEDAGEDGESHLSQMSHKSEWRDFSCAVLFALPLVGDRVVFEVEFSRCCVMMSNAADTEEKKQEAEQKISWLAEQYLSYHGSPADADIWEDFRSNAIPNLSLSGNTSSKLSGLPQSSSTQAIFTPSPHLDGNGKSPNLGAFSPRPNDNDRMMSLLDVLGETPPAPQGSSSKSQSWRQALPVTGFSRDILLSVDSQLIARSLFVFNQKALEHVPHNVTTSVCQLLDSSDDLDPSGPRTSVISPLTPFIGCDGSPHWLTKLILIQVLISDTPTYATVANHRIW